jgi:hypothetical protein
MNKNLRKLLAALMCLSVLLAVSCGKKPEEDDNKPEDLTPAEISELAMENFVKKLQDGNYTCGTENVLLTTAVSPDQVYFTYPHEGYPTIYAYMTLYVETFATVIENNIRYETEFISVGTAIEAAGNALPNSWYDLTGGNMFEFFYNDPEDPLVFTSNDENVKYTLGCLGGYGQPALELMQEVRMTLDAVDPTSVRFTAELEEDGMYHYDDLDLTLTFGTGKPEPHIEEWYKRPDYPAVRTGWTRSDEAQLNTVFMRGYGAEAVPFPEFAGYALIFDDTAYDSFGGIRITDHNATLQDVEDYKALLLRNGFKEVQEKQDDGSTATVYRKLLRDEYKAYAELYPVYDKGFELIGMPYYEDRHYDGWEAMSAAVAECGFPELTETDVFEGWSATDEAMSRSESLAYFFDYQMYMPFILTFSDGQAAREYWDGYCDRLEASGFSEAVVSDEGKREFRNFDGSKLFRYTFGEDGVRLDFKSEKLLSVEEMNGLLDRFGIPGVHFEGTIGGRDQAKYRYEISEFTGLFFTGTKYFAGSAEAEAFLDSYTAELEDSGYYRTDPEKAASRRQFLYLNEDEWKYVGFDYYPGDEEASILFEFYAGGAGEEQEQVSLMQSAIGY